MKDMSRGPTASPLASMTTFSPSKWEAVLSVLRNQGKDIWLLTTATDADESEGSSATSATVPSESSSSTPLPHKGPPSTLRKFEQTFCLTHWWNPAAHRPNGCQCATTYPSSGKMEVYP